MTIWYKWYTEKHDILKVKGDKMLTIVNGVTSKQVLANEIINLLETMGLDGYFYLGYPVLGGIDGKIKVDALLVSEQTGIVLFDL